jgi:uncharacterized protein
MNLLILGVNLYDCRQRWIRYRFVPVFVIRSLLYWRQFKDLQGFLQQNELRSRFLATHPKVFAQLTRQLFYRGSRPDERLRIIKESFSMLEKAFTKDALEKMYLDESETLRLWEMPYLDGKALSLDLTFRDGESREGMMTLALQLDGCFVYHINFWLLQEFEKKIMVIGCHQGKKDGLRINKGITKNLFGYRPKNLILYALRILANHLGINRLKAVSNYGFYASNHYFRDRKLKVSYDVFWQECGGRLADDRRFFFLPLTEPRKTIKEIPTRKRAVYKKRFAFLDSLAIKLSNSLRQNENEN